MFPLKANLTVTKATCVLLLVLAVSCFGGCAIFGRPKAATDPAYIAAFQTEKSRWERLARQTYTGMTLVEFERILPPDASLPGVTGGANYISKGKTRPQAHTERWYYISPHFICSTEFDFTGLKYKPDGYSSTGEFESAPEFPGPEVPGLDPSQQLTLTGATITLVEPRRVKKPE